MIKKMSRLPLALSLLFTLAACSEDDDYTSRMPEIADVEITTFAGGDSTQVRIIQSSKGRFVHRSSCTWTVEPVLDSELSYDSNRPGDTMTPTCKFKTPAAGVYTITYKGKYGIDGKSSSGSWKKQGNGWNASYTMSVISGEVSVKATHRISR